MHIYKSLDSKLNQYLSQLSLQLHSKSKAFGGLLGLGVVRRAGPRKKQRL